MDRRRFLGSTALAGVAVFAGCSADNARDRNESATDQGAPTTSNGSLAETVSTADDSEELTTPKTTETPSPAVTTLRESAVVELSGPPCDAVDGATFESIEKREGGLADQREGARFHWRVRLEDGTFHSSFSDIVESGEYTCTAEDGGARLRRTPDSSGSGYLGTYDPETGVLVWNGVRYRPVDVA